MMFDGLNASAMPMWGVAQAQNIDDTNYQLCSAFEIRKAGSSKLTVQFSKYSLHSTIPGVQGKIPDTKKVMEIRACINSRAMLRLD